MFIKRSIHLHLSSSSCPILLWRVSQIPQIKCFRIYGSLQPLLSKILRPFIRIQLLLFLIVVTQLQPWAQMFIKMRKLLTCVWISKMWKLRKKQWKGNWRKLFNLLINRTKWSWIAVQGSAEVQQLFWLGLSVEKKWPYLKPLLFCALNVDLCIQIRDSGAYS